MAIVLIRFVPVALSRRLGARAQDEDKRCPITNTCDGSPFATWRQSGAVADRDSSRSSFPPRCAIYETRPGCFCRSFFPSLSLPFSLILSFTYRHRRRRAAAFCEFWRGCSGHGRRRMPFSFRLHSRSSFDRDASWLTKLNLTDRTDIRTESKISSLLRSHVPGFLFLFFSILYFNFFGIIRFQI